MSFIYRKNGQYLRYSEQRTHTGTHFSVSWVSDINQATILGSLPPLRIREECKDAEILRVKEHRQLQVVPLEANQPQACPLNAVDDVCKTSNGNGIYSVGAVSALRAMSHHWQDHLAEGHSPKIITDDIDGLIDQLRAMQASLFARVCPAAQLDQLPRKEEPEAAMLTPSIDAEAHDDGHQITAHFDAAAWFAQASDEALWGLYSCGWARDYQADAVAEFYEYRDDDVKKMFELVRISQNTRNPVGFECCVESDQAMAWLAIHRKPLWARILCDQHGVKLSQSQDDGSLGRWDWLTDTNEGSELSFETKDEAALNAVETLGLTAE